MNLKRDIPITVPADLRHAEELLEQYGRWAQDRYKKQRCASAEGAYRPPANREEEPMVPFIADWSAMQVQQALQVVPMQYRRVLFAIYVPQKEHPFAARRRYRLQRDVWDHSRIEGLRRFWAFYRLRYLTERGTIAPILRDTESCALVA
ncbi:hypothetical protein [Comamonas terrigena]|uniref:hypothetical protein n=1 Tax=Comamonas terrigena TaxID=32013 RepID=UPI0028992FCF|nr:hypothetical protein [Comamonas terrigena]